MPAAGKVAGTGLEGLDRILDGLRLGDNVVWNIDRVQDYKMFTVPFVKNALAHGHRVVYLKFADKPSLPKTLQRKVKVYELDAGGGFESFTVDLHRIIASEGKGVFYVFDCLSNLLSAWATDRMIGDFFRVTCPYLFEMDTIAYFSILRGHHSHKTTARIRETTQLLLNVYHYNRDTYLQPVKVWQRKSPTMFNPHLVRDGKFEPITRSRFATELAQKIQRGEAEKARRQLDYWQHLFLDAANLNKSKSPPEMRRKMLDQLCRVMIGRDRRILELAMRHFDLQDLLDINARLIGSGFIGGKAVGILLARKILLSDKTFNWQDRLEAHDSFHVGTDVYHSFLIHNGLWKTFSRQKSEQNYFEAGALLHEQIPRGDFPADIRDQFRSMLDYFGQYPIIVRSSSLLEDSFGNAFAGKYMSCFLVNQGSPEERYGKFVDAVRSIFASTMSSDALTYRRQRGLDKQDEQMALLVQRVSGSYRNQYYFPDIAGVGVSYNTFAWSPELRPEAGMLRMVLGLGTRAVDRVENDYPRIVALDAPMKKAHKGFDDTRKYSQRDVDVLNISRNTFQTVSLLSLENDKTEIPFELFGQRDVSGGSGAGRDFEGTHSWVITFDKLLKGPFTRLMKRMLKTLEKSYQYPLEIEFTANLDQNHEIFVNPVQCRPMQTLGRRGAVELPDGVDGNDTLFTSDGNFMGGNIQLGIRRIIWVKPETYNPLTISEKYEVARLVGRLNRLLPPDGKLPTMLIGPGRWGTSTPSMGVPVRFSEINRMASLVEVEFQREGFIPELSFGTHFFHDLVETEIFYVALFAESQGNLFNRLLLENTPNRIEELAPDCGKLKWVVHVADFGRRPLKLMSDIVRGRVICFSGGAK